MVVVPAFGQRMIDDLKIGMTVKEAEATLGRTLASGGEVERVGLTSFLTLRETCGSKWTLQLVFEKGTLRRVALHAPSYEGARKSDAYLNCVRANLETKYGKGRMANLSREFESGELMWQKDGIEIRLSFGIYPYTDRGLVDVYYGKPEEKGF